MRIDWDLQAFEDISKAEILAAVEKIRPEISASPTLQIGDVTAKLENRIPTGAFKVRGGLIYFDWLKQFHPNIKVAIAATRGNHGQSVAFAATRAGMESRIVVPFGNSPMKNRAMQELGAEIIEHGKDFAEALEFAAGEAEKIPAHFVPSFDWKLVLGVSTYSYELFSGYPALKKVFVPIGLGSGICGAIAVRNALNLRTEIIGVVAEKAPAYAESFLAGELINGREIPDTIADGVACRIPNADSFDVIKRHVTDIEVVPEESIRDAMKEIHETTGETLEGAGAIAYAAWKMKRPKHAAVIFSGGNVDR